MDDDSDVKLLGASDEVSLGEKLPPSVRGDSNVRLERVPFPSPSGLDVGSMTEEINLDEELKMLPPGTAMTRSNPRASRRRLRLLSSEVMRP